MFKWRSQVTTRIWADTDGIAKSAPVTSLSSMPNPDVRDEILASDVELPQLDFNSTILLASPVAGLPKLGIIAHEKSGDNTWSDLQFITTPTGQPWDNWFHGSPSLYLDQRSCKPYLYFAGYYNRGDNLQIGSIAVAIPPAGKTFSFPLCSTSSTAGSGMVKIKRVGQNLSTVSAPPTAAWLDDMAPSQTNTLTLRNIAAGTHTAYASAAPGYEIKAGTCTRTLNVPGECTVRDFPITPTCDTAKCGVSVEVANNQLTKVVFRLVPAVIVQSNVIGYSAPPISKDGVVPGWAFDRGDKSKILKINFYIDNGGDTTYNGGASSPIPDGTATADGTNYQAHWDWGASIFNSFTFKIPEKFRDGKAHTMYVQPIGIDGKVKAPISHEQSNNYLSFTLQPTIVENSFVIDTRCLSPDSNCVSRADDYLLPNYPAAAGWSDGRNYFNEWECTSPTGINTISRLNIIPSGTHGPSFQKDSIYWYPTEKNSIYGGENIIYFSGTRQDNTASSIFSLKKAVFDVKEGRWKILDMLDYPANHGGISSLDGRYPDYIVNDYSIPGWGPASLTPGSKTKIPGVSNQSTNTQIGSYPLRGTGPLGLTTIREFLQGPGVHDGGPQGRTCLHINPKLFDYDANGVPHSMIVSLQRDADTSSGWAACKLPPGAPMAELPSIGEYIYRYNQSTGWQLDLSYAPVAPTSHQAMKPTWGNQHHFLSVPAAEWGGKIKMVNIDEPAPRPDHLILDCSATANNPKFKHVVYFGEPSGDETMFMFIAIPPDRTLDGDGTLKGVFNLDIYYAWHQ